MLVPSNMTMQKMTLPKGTMSKAMASMTMTMRRAGLGTLKPFDESPTGRLGVIPSEVANAGRPLRFMACKYCSGAASLLILAVCNF